MKKKVKPAFKYELELATYEKLLPKLMKKDAGKFVLIMGDKLIGIYPTQWDAAKSGMEKFPYQDIFTRRIQTEPHVIFNYGMFPFR